MAVSSESRRRPMQDRSHQTVVRILTAAVEMIRERGGHSFTTNHIAERAGVSITSLYRFFPNKLSVLRELHELWLEEVLDNMDRYADEHLEGSPWQTFFSGLRETGTVDWLDDQAAQRLWHLAAVTPELADFNTQYNQQVAARLEGYLAHYGSPISKSELLAAALLLNQLHNSATQQSWNQPPAVARAVLRFGDAAQLRILEACQLTGVLT